MEGEKLRSKKSVYCVTASGVLQNFASCSISQIVERCGKCEENFGVHRRLIRLKA